MTKLAFTSPHSLAHSTFKGNRSKSSQRIRVRIELLHGQDPISYTSFFSSLTHSLTCNLTLFCSLIHSFTTPEGLFKELRSLLGDKSSWQRSVTLFEPLVPPLSFFVVFLFVPSLSLLTRISDNAAPCSTRVPESVERQTDLEQHLKYLHISRVGHSQRHPPKPIQSAISPIWPPSMRGLKSNKVGVCANLELLTKQRTAAL